jgi:farnesyl-diphosphate farnesyltransferase
MCLAHFQIDPVLDRLQLIDNSIRFGKGLQLVNILRDLSADLLKGRCYIPEPALRLINLSPSDLTKPANMEKFRPLYDSCLDRAQQHLQAGWQYTNTLPFSWLRVRLACAWPVLIGLRTIAHLRRENPLDGSRRVKASRREVKSIMLRSVLTYPFRALWNAQPARALTLPVR